MWKKNASDREKLLKFEADCGEFAKFLRSLEKFIQAVKKIQLEMLIKKRQGSIFYDIGNSERIEKTPYGAEKLLQ